MQEHVSAFLLHCGSHKIRVAPVFIMMPSDNSAEAMSEQSQQRRRHSQNKFQFYEVSNIQGVRTKSGLLSSRM